MDPRTNPYFPGAGTRPRELAGRDAWLEQAAIALDRIRGGLPDRSLILYGLRGVGKTVLLNRIREEAVARGFVVVPIEAAEQRSLPGLLVPALRATLLRLSRVAAAKSLAERALRALAGFVGAAEVRFGDIEVKLDLGAERGLADSGALDLDLGDLLGAVAAAARAGGTAVVLFLDELQYVPEEQLAALVMALHGTSQQELPVAMVGAGLPQILGRAGRARSYAERLFAFASIDRLDEAAARQALVIPAAAAGVAFTEGAIAEILHQTRGYPYFLQEWGKHCWTLAPASPIDRADAERATMEALAELDGSFFRVRFERLTPTERNYLWAMAGLGGGPHRSGDIAERLGRPVTAVAPVRNALISKGMIYSPAHGDTGFTVPLFDGFMARLGAPRR